MRRLFVLLLIALLPLRGWVGEVMAGEMLAQQITAAASTAFEATAHGLAPATATLDEAAPAIDHDCAGHLASQSEPGPSGLHGCATCASCQVCSSVAIAFNTVAPQPARQVFTPPVPSAWHVASAEPAPAFKPPIS